MLPDDWKGRRYQQFKDSEVFGKLNVHTSGGSIVLNAPTPRVGDMLLINAGSSNVYYNLGISGGDVAVSTSGTMLAAGAERSYNDVGFDVVGLTTSAGVTDIYVHKIYSNRP